MQTHSNTPYAAQVLKDAQKYPHLDVHLYAFMRLVAASLAGSRLDYKMGYLTLTYNAGRNWLFMLKPKGLQFATQVWGSDAQQALNQVISGLALDDLSDLHAAPLYYKAQALYQDTQETRHINPSGALLALWCELDALIAAVECKTAQPAQPAQPNYGDAQGSGINIHSQGGYYPLYHMYWRGQDWLCYANHAIPAKQCSDVLRSMSAHDRTAYVVRYGIEIHKTSCTDRHTQSSIYPLEVRMSAKHGKKIFVWANRWLPYSQELHRHLETRTTDERIACMQCIGEVYM